MSNYKNKKLSIYGVLRIIVAVAVIAVGVAVVRTPVSAAINVTADPFGPHTDTQVKIQWSTVANAATYEIYRDGVSIHTIDVSSSLVFDEYVDGADLDPLTPATEYAYEVCALDEDNNILSSGTDNATTSAMLPPSDVKASYNVNSKEVTLTWTNNSAATTQSSIKDAYDDSDVSGDITGDITSYTFTDASLDNGSVQYVVVSADGSGHVSAYSGPVTVTPIPAPAVTASVVNGTVTISWGGYSDIAYFNLERNKWNGTGWNGTWDVVNTYLSGSSTQDIPTAAGSYRYRLNAKSTGNYSGCSNSSGMVTKPAAPTGVTCTITAANRIDLSWQNNAGNNCSLRIQRRDGSSGTFNTVATLDASATAYADIYNFSIGASYYYKIVAYDSDSNSAASSEYLVRMAVPAAPSYLRLTVESTTKITLEWQNNETGSQLFTFKIERKSDTEANYSEIGTVESSTATYADTDGLISGHTYTYRVRAGNPIGNSAYSNETFADTTIISPPSSLSAVAVSNSQITLGWAYTNSVNFKTIIERKTGADGTWGAITSTPLAAGITTYTDSGLSANTQYFYRVKAVSASNSNVYSLPYPNNNTGIGCYTKLNSPTLYANASASNQIYLSWNAEVGQTQFAVERKTANGSYFSLATLDTGTYSWYDNNIIPNAQYTYRIKATSTGNESVYSNEVTITNSFLESPTGLKAVTGTESEIELSWLDNSIDESGFEIWRYTYGVGSWGVYATVGRNVKTFVDANIQPGIQYGYMVRACDAARNIYSAFSNSASAGLGVLTPPDNLQVRVVSNSQVVLRWTDNSSNESGFKVERKAGTGGEWMVIASLSANTISYTNTGLLAYTQYFYRIRAYSYNYSSDSLSNEVEVSTGIPQAPKELAAVVVSSTQVGLTWTDASSNEQGFKIERRKSGEKSYREIAHVEPGVTGYTDRGLQPSTLYYYRIRAYNMSGSSESGVESAFTKGQVIFNDVDGVAWAKEAIENLASRDIIKGKSGDSFEPNDVITRAEFTCLIVRAFNMDMTPVGSFADVKTGKWYYNELMIAKGMGIISGDDDNRFYPDKPITREDIAVIISKAMKVIGKPLAGYGNDVLEKYRDKNMVSPYALSSMASLVGEEIMAGRSENSIAPKDSATRAEAAVLIYKIVDR